MARVNRRDVIRMGAAGGAALAGLGVRGAGQASAAGTNGVIVAVIAILVSLMGFKAFLLVHLPIMLLAASVGVWLFYVQHQFEGGYWARSANWNGPLHLRRFPAAVVWPLQAANAFVTM